MSASSSNDRVPIDHNLCSVLRTLQLWHIKEDGHLTEPSNIQVSGKNSRTYIRFAQEASRAGMSNEIILTAVIAHVIMSGWPGTALHEQRIRQIREVFATLKNSIPQVVLRKLSTLTGIQDHRAMLRHNTPLADNICAIYEESVTDSKFYRGKFRSPHWLRCGESVRADFGFWQRVQFPTFYVTITMLRLLEIAYNLASAWSRFPAVRSVSGAVATEATASNDHGSIDSYKQEVDKLRGIADSLPFKVGIGALPSREFLWLIEQLQDELPLDLLDMLDATQPQVGSRRAPDPSMLVDFDRHTSILMRVWQWVLVDIRQITVWFETAADMVAYPFYMQLCLDRGMEIWMRWSIGWTSLELKTPVDPMMRLWSFS
ncbi:hypothetical protein BP00DRAFT_416795 [Aspergillus indologenus CBS 114.80]|uniref:Uncharacterized protein n=1 Tax=Aspergillus indologenus CBS 114.80 TaxID=1450541 RepID=A0A2V5HZK8_9EURO|nr:hypothetical protein BP00DRAFT_416795 [Aspergillus indologenus CBS 114.80]